MRTLYPLLALLFCAPALHAQSFQGLGDLPGGTFTSRAYGVSADGAVVVGEGSRADGNDGAFRWTASGGMVDLGDLPGGNFYSRARGVSADGAVVVGDSNSDDNGEGPKSKRVGDSHTDGL